VILDHVFDKVILDHVFDEVIFDHVFRRSDPIFNEVIKLDFRRSDPRSDPVSVKDLKILIKIFHSGFISG